MEDQSFCLRWEKFQSSVTSVFDHLRQDEQLVDITLCCEGQRVKAHRIMLSACSPYFREILSETQCQHLVLFLRDTSAADLRAIVQFMYRGVVNVTQSQLASFIKTAEMLQIKGLSGDEDKLDQSCPPPPPPPPPTQAASPRQRSGSGGNASPSPAAKRPRRSPDPELGPGPVAVKLEKPEPPDEDDVIPDLTLDATPGYVTACEDGAGGSGHGVVRLNRRDSQTAPGDTVHQGGGVTSCDLVSVGRPGRSPLPASSSPGPGTGRSNGADPTTAAGGAPNQHPCDLCGKVYKYRISLLAHRKHHEGRTTCFVCGHTSSTVQNLRQHLRFVHRLAHDEVSRRTGLQRVRLTAADAAPPPPPPAARRSPATAGPRQVSTPPPPSPSHPPPPPHAPSCKPSHPAPLPPRGLTAAQGSTQEQAVGAKISPQRRTAVGQFPQGQNPASFPHQDQSAGSLRGRGGPAQPGSTGPGTETSGRALEPPAASEPSAH